MDSLLFHPKVVHLPIALAILMPWVAGGALWAWRRGWIDARAWVGVLLLQVALLGSGVLAMNTGEQEEERVEQVVAETHIEAHEEAAESFVWASAAVLILLTLPLVLRGGRLRRAASVSAVLGTVVVLGLGYRTGEAGGRLVYQYGAAEVYSNDAGVSPRVETEDLESKDGEDDDD